MTDQPPSAAQRLEAAVQAWLQGHIAGGPIARATDCWNHLVGAVPALTVALLKEIG